MPKWAMKWVAALVLLLIASPSFAATQTSPAAKQIQALYDQAGNLMVKQDVRGLVKYLQETRTSSYAYISKQSGKRSLIEMIQSMAMVLSTFRVIKAGVHVDQCHVNGSTAIVTITTRIEMVTKASKGHIAHTLGQETHGEDTWIKTDGAWKLKQSKVATESITQDGRPVTN
jgi:hypothetical protein